MGVKSRKKTAKKTPEIKDNEEIKLFAQMYPYFESSMIFFENRLETYKKWPFPDNVVCCPKNMAEAGFYCIGEDCAKCYYCEKELDGWEENDCPMTEHTKHSIFCPFVKHKASHIGEDLTVGHVLDLETARIHCALDREFDKVTQMFNGQDLNKFRRYKFHL